MPKKDTFQIVVEYTLLSQRKKLPETQQLPYFFHKKTNKSYYDHVTFECNRVLINGSRTKISEKKPLATIKSTFYFDIIRALLLLYFYDGRFSVDCIKLNVNDKPNSTYDKSEIDQFFIDDLKERVIINDLDDIIRETDLTKSRYYVDFLIYLVLASQESIKIYDKFTYAWRAFELSICHSFPNKPKENHNTTQCLKALRDDLEKSQPRYKNSIAKAEEINEKSISILRLEAFLKHTYPSKSNECLCELFNSFKDHRVRKALDQSIRKYTNLSSDKLDFEPIGNEHNPVDILRLFVLKYAYFLRNSLFHANQMSRFLIKNDLMSELEFITNFLILLEIDIFNYYHNKW